MCRYTCCRHSPLVPVRASPTESEQSMGTWPVTFSGHRSGNQQQQQSMPRSNCSRYHIPYQTDGITTHFLGSNSGFVKSLCFGSGDMRALIVAFSLQIAIILLERAEEKHPISLCLPEGSRRTCGYSCDAGANWPLNCRRIVASRFSP